MRLAVFTSQYPTRGATFFERDLRALLDAGIEIELFAIYPLDADLWRYALDILDHGRLPRNRVHHLRLRDAVVGSQPMWRARAGTIVRDAAAIVASGARFGPTTLVKTAYTLPKAWAWAAEHGDRFDHVLAYWGNYAGTCAYAFHRLLPRAVPFSIWLHAGTDLYRTPVFLRQKLLYADNVITCCDFNRGFLLNRFRAIASTLAPKIHICHHGLDLGTLPYRHNGRRRRHVVAVGRLKRHKGFEYLLRAVHLLYARGIDVTVDLVGEGDQRGALQGLVAELGIADRVRFRGWLPFPEVRRAMNEATVLVHPSPGLGDGLPNVIREAMAVGTPVIASRVAGIPDALEDDCGVLVAPRDITALAGAIADLVDDPAACRSVAERARRRVERQYDLGRNGAELARILRNTARRGCAPAAVEPPHAEAAPERTEGVLMTSFHRTGDAPSPGWHRQAPCGSGSRHDARQ